MAHEHYYKVQNSNILPVGRVNHIMKYQNNFNEEIIREVNIFLLSVAVYIGSNFWKDFIHHTNYIDICTAMTYKIQTIKQSVV